MAQLIYQAGFEDGALEPVVHPTGLGPLQISQAPGLPGLAWQKMALEPPGLRATLTRTDPSPTPDNAGATRDDCYVAAIVNPFPHDITRFKIRATFELPDMQFEPNADPTYGWAMVIFARTGDVTYWPTRDERITVTLRSANVQNKVQVDPFGILNTPGGKALPSEPVAPIPAALYQGIFKPHDAQRSRFTLELLVDRPNKVARAGLDARIYRQIGRDPSPLDASVSYSERRWFTHLLVTNFHTDIGPGETREALPIDSVGVGIGIARGQVTASATILDFRICRLNMIDIWLLKFEEWIAKLLG